MMIRYLGYLISHEFSYQPNIVGLGGCPVRLARFSDTHEY